MTDVIFYSVIGLDTKKIQPVKSLEKRFAITEENSFVCKRIGRLSRDPTLLLIQQGTKQFVQELANRDTIYGPYNDNQHRSARQSNPQAIASSPKLHAAAGILSPVALKGRAFFSIKVWDKIMQNLLTKKPTPTQKRLPAGTSIVAHVRKILDAAAVKQLMLSALGEHATAEDREPLANLVQQLENALTQLYSNDFARYMNEFKDELEAYPETRINVCRAAL